MGAKLDFCYAKSTILMKFTVNIKEKKLQDIRHYKALALRLVKRKCDCHLNRNFKINLLDLHMNIIRLKSKLNTCDMSFETTEVLVRYHAVKTTTIHRLTASTKDFTT